MCVQLALGVLASFKGGCGNCFFRWDLTCLFQVSDSSPSISVAPGTGHVPYLVEASDESKERGGQCIDIFAFNAHYIHICMYVL
jgi:hypothetical protein